MSQPDKPTAVERAAQAQAKAERGREAYAEYLADAERIEANTARLKALRLAKQAADHAEAAEVPARPAKARTTRRARSSSS